MVKGKEEPMSSEGVETGAETNDEYFTILWILRNSLGIRV